MDSLGFKICKFQEGKSHVYIAHLRQDCHNLKLGIFVLRYRIILNRFNTVTLASSRSMLPDDGDHTETCWSYFNFNADFNTTLKTILLCISW